MSAGISITLDVGALDQALFRLRPLAELDTAPLAEEIAALGESQTRRRITDEKTAPDGTPWPPNRAGTSILLETGQHLLANVASYSSAEEAVWGDSWEFAHIHQEGATITAQTAKALRFQLGGKTIHAKSVTIPAREFVGISVENAIEIDELVTDYLRRLLR